MTDGSTAKLAIWLRLTSSLRFGVLLERAKSGIKMPPRGLVGADSIPRDGPRYGKRDYGV